MDRNFNEREINQIINDSMEVCTNLYPYYCKENTECWTAIKQSVNAVKANKINPEEYWHGKRDSTDRKLILRWIPPIAVKIDDAELPTVIRPVES